MKSDSDQTPPPVRFPWALLCFLIGFIALLILLLDRYLFPAVQAARNASPRERQYLSAASLLLLAVVLTIIPIAIIVLFRVRRYFFPRHTPPRTKTPYVDAWAESGRRMQPPSESREDQ